MAAAWDSLKPKALNRHNGNDFVILSEAKNLWIISQEEYEGTEMFRFAQHDSNSLAVFNALTLQGITTLAVNLHDKLAIRIDVAAIHAVCIKRQCDVTVLVDCDQTAAAAELFHSVESVLSCFLQLHLAMLH